MNLKEVISKIRTHDKRLDDHEGRIASLEKKFDFIKTTLITIKDSMPKGFKNYLKNLDSWKIVLIILIVLILAGVIFG